ncbi:hypothetical protein Hanom_Chr01g00073181 [Helianthus anomalus]
MRGGQVMSALDFIKLDDTSDVVLGDTEAIEGEVAITRTAEGRLVLGGTITRRSSRLLKGPGQSSAVEHVGLNDEIEFFKDQGIEVEGKMELAVVTGKKGKLSGKKAVVSFAGGYSERSGEEPLRGMLRMFMFLIGSSNLAMQEDVLISRMLLGVCHLSAILPEGVSRFRKRMHEYEEFSKEREKTKASMAAMRKEIEGFAEKEKSWVVKVHELTKRHEIELSNEKKRMEADRLQLRRADREALNVQQKAFLDEKEGLKASLSQATSDNQWLIEHGFQQVFTYLLHSTEFNSALGDVYTKLLNHGKHLGFVARYKAHESGQLQEQSSFY